MAQCTRILKQGFDANWTLFISAQMFYAIWITKNVLAQIQQIITLFYPTPLIVTSMDMYDIKDYIVNLDHVKYRKDKMITLIKLFDNTSRFIGPLDK